MSDRIVEITSAVDEYVKPFLRKKTTSERQRIEMRKYLLALEKMIHEIRRDLLNESKEIKKQRKERKNNLYNIENAETL